MKQEFLDLEEYIPLHVKSGKKETKIKLLKYIDDDRIHAIYTTNHFNNSQREHSLSIPRKINFNEETLEALGLLQAEMGKTNNGCLNFTNSEFKLINKVTKWFEKEFELPINTWQWYIKVNMQEPNNLEYKQQVEEKVVSHWIKKSKIDIARSHPKKVVYKKDSKRKTLKNNFYGSLILEYKSNLFSQIIKNFIKEITYKNIINYQEIYIRSYLKGIIAGEGCIESDKRFKKYRVHISVTKKEEKEVYFQCLKRLRIESKKYKKDKLIISKRENNIQLLKQRLMTLHPRKYNKFLNMMKQYPNIEYETNYFKPKGQNIWNKISQEKIDKIVELYNLGITKTNEIANRLEISQIKVQRVLKKNNLGKSKISISEELRKQIAYYAKNHPELNLKIIADKFNVHVSVAVRAYRRYYGIRGMAANKKTPKGKEQEVINLYTNHPTIKVSEVCHITGVSDSVIKRVRKENSLTHLGHQHLIGCNNSNKEEISNSKAFKPFL